ncbi:MAG: carboxypeptidase-like regulatory domain-containing protein, partial [Bacteroidales bacterium]|nr:carboxypeptidase-like regulatory domain-containing protein [Bacteroidales bacterium]
MKRLILAVLCLCLVKRAVSQTRITGQVVDANDKSPVPFAQVALFSIKDTALVNGTTTADNGQFSIDKIRKGQYIFRAQFVGYTTFENVITIEDEAKPFEMGSIEMQKGVVLKEFEITENFIPVQIKEDTVEFNAEAFRPVEGSALEELLKRLPGVEVDK